MLSFAKNGAKFLLNSPYSRDEVWDQLPHRVQQQLIEKNIKFFVIDANEVADKTGMRGRINTIMQTCFFKLSGVLPEEEAIKQIKKAIEKTYIKKGQAVVDKNFEAVDQTLANLFEVKIPTAVTAEKGEEQTVDENAPDFVKNITYKMMIGKGDDLPVSAIPADGTYPNGTTKWEKRNISEKVAHWNADICIQCGNCSFVCPHSVIRSKFYHKDLLTEVPEGFQSAPINARGFPETKFTLQVYEEDCTGCKIMLRSMSCNRSKKRRIARD